MVSRIHPSKLTHFHVVFNFQWATRVPAPCGPPANDSFPGAVGRPSMITSHPPQRQNPHPATLFWWCSTVVLYHVIPCYAMLYLKSMLYQSVLITSKYPFMPGHPGMRPRSRQDVVLQHVFEGVEEQQGAKDADRWVEPGQNRPGYQSVWGICGGSEYHERLETWIQWDEISSMVFGAQWCSWHA